MYFERISRYLAYVSEANCIVWFCHVSRIQRYMYVIRYENDHNNIDKNNDFSHNAISMIK